jgi:predicted kinase
MNLKFKDWLQIDEDYSARIERKCVMLLGSPGAGKTYIGNQFVSQGYRKVLIDNFFQGLMRKTYNIPAGEPVQASLDNPAHLDIFNQATRMSNKLMYGHMLQKGYPFITEKTGRNTWTIRKTKDACTQAGYDLYGILIQTPLDIAIARNRARPERALKHDDELRGEYEAIYNSSNIAELKKIFGDSYFFIVNGDGSPESQKQVNQVVNVILQKPVRSANVAV